MTWTPKRAGRTTRATSPWSSSPRAYTFPCFTSPAAFTIISGVMKLSMTRLSCSPHSPQCPRLPHLPGTVQGAGSFASLSSSGYCGAGWALATASDRKNTSRARLANPTRRDVRRFMACASLGILEISRRALASGCVTWPPATQGPGPGLLVARGLVKSKVRPQLAFAAALEKLRRERARDARPGQFTKDGCSAIRQGFRRLFSGRRGPCLQRENVVVPPDAEETERDKLCPACRELPPAPQGTEDKPHVEIVTCLRRGSPGFPPVAAIGTGHARAAHRLLARAGDLAGPGRLARRARR